MTKRRTNEVRVLVEQKRVGARSALVIDRSLPWLHHRGRKATGHTLRHTAATWLRQQTGDTRLVAEYLGDADLFTVSRYAHVAERELHEATAAPGRLASTAVSEEDGRQAA
jgi:integrase